MPIEWVSYLKKHGINLLISIARDVLFLLLAFVVLYPLFTKISAAFMSVEDIHDLSVRYIPKHITLDHVIDAWNNLKLSTSYLLTVQFVTLIALLQMISATWVGYGLARFKFKLKKPLLLSVILGLVLPPDLLLIPLYTLFRNFRLFGLIPLLNNGEGISLINTQIPLIVLAVTSTGFRCGLYILIMHQYFRGMPKELEEAAYIDGADPIKTFFSVILPGAKTMMITIFLFSFVWTWLDNDFVPIFMGESNILVNLARNLNGLHSGGAADEITRNLIAYAGILFLVIPLLFLYLFTQRFFVQSVERSGLVG
ncbi:MAG: ABC transporter permease subunit [Eubacteriales bacterium]|nr:ABC transporter permease subunit [Eubacteriales bacterium]